MAPIDGFKEEDRERVFDGCGTALHKRRGFSPRHLRFCKSKDFSNLYIGKVHAFGSGPKEDLDFRQRLLDYIENVASECLPQNPDSDWMDIDDIADVL